MLLGNCWYAVQCVLCKIIFVICSYLFVTEATCMFDVTTCAHDCPFGYQPDARGCDIGCDCATESNFQGDIHFDEHTLPTYMKVMDP